MTDLVRLRPGLPSDAVPIAALATQVFLDTYATQGVRPDLAREAFEQYSESAFARRFMETTRRFIVAENDGALVGFAEILCSGTQSPAPSTLGAELVRLYVQPRAQRRGVGRLLLSEGESLATANRLPCLWLTVWEGNANAIAFYRRMGYAEVGTTTYSFQGHTYGNRVFAKALVTGSHGSRVEG